MADKIVTKLPGVLQTPAIKNFFESTVEQLYSKANTENVKGLIRDPIRTVTIRIITHS